MECQNWGRLWGHFEDILKVELVGRIEVEVVVVCIGGVELGRGFDSKEQGFVSGIQGNRHLR